MRYFDRFLLVLAALFAVLGWSAARRLANANPNAPHRESSRPGPATWEHPARSLANEPLGANARPGRRSRAQTSPAVGEERWPHPSWN